MRAILAALAPLVLAFVAPALAVVAPPVTYQGELRLEGRPVDDVCDFELTLFEALAGGSPIVGPVGVFGTPVTAGRFTVLVEGWPTTVWDGERFLEVAVACPAGGSPVVLAPRQPVTSAPTAALALAVSGGSIDSLALVNGSVTASKIAAGAVGSVQIDATQVQRRIGSCAAGSSIRAVAENGAVTCETDDGGSLAQVRTVAKSGGDFTSIQAALDSITDASSSKPYLVSVGPGTYPEQVTLEPYVTVRGAGRFATRIVGHGGASATEESATVVGANNAELSDLEVECDGSGDIAAIGIYNSSASPRLERLTVRASNANANYAIVNISSGAAIADVGAFASGGGTTTGIQAVSSTVRVIRTIARASGAIGSGYGVAVFNGGGGTWEELDASAQGNGTNRGLYNVNAGPTVRRSVLAGSTYSVASTGAGAVVEIAHSQLNGPVSTGLLCFGNHDGAYAAVACP